MKKLAFALLVVAVLGCKKSDNAGGAAAPGSGSAPGSAAAAAGSAAPGSAAATPPAADFDDKLALPKQPARDKDEQARVDAAADALRAALTKAKTAKDSAELCKAFDPLGKAMTKLQLVTAPKGIEKDFSAERDALLQLFDGASNYCDNPANVGLDTLRDVMAQVRTHFITLVGMGAK